MKTINLIALLSLVTFSAMAEETPLMTQTQNQGEGSRIEQQVERQTMQANMYGKKSELNSGTGLQTQTRARLRLQDGSGSGLNMGGGMQGGSMQGGGMRGGGMRGGGR